MYNKSKALIHAAALGMPMTSLITIEKGLLYGICTTANNNRQFILYFFGATFTSNILQINSNDNEARVWPLLLRKMCLQQ